MGVVFLLPLDDVSDPSEDSSCGSPSSVVADLLCGNSALFSARKFLLALITCVLFGEGDFLLAGAFPFPFFGNFA